MSTYDAPPLLLLAKLLVLTCYSCLVLCGSTNIQEGMWTVELKVNVFIAGAMFVLNTRDGALSRYKNYILRLRFVEAGFLFQLPSEIAGVLKFIGLYKCAHRMSTDLVKRAMAIHQSSEADWKKLLCLAGPFRTHYTLVRSTARRKGLCRLPNECWTDDSTATLSYAGLSMVIYTNVANVNLETIWMDYDEWPDVWDGLHETGGKRCEKSATSDALLQHDLK